MSVKTGETVVVDFTVASPSTGELQDADSLPTAALVLNGTDDAATVTVTNKSTGRYKASVTLPAIVKGDRVQLFVAATVDAVDGGGVIWEDVGDTKHVGDLVDAAAAPSAAAVRAEIDANSTMLAGIRVDTEDLQARVPAALTGDGLMASDAVRVGGELVDPDADPIGDAIPAIVAAVWAGLDAAGLRAALGLAAASLDTQLAAIAAKTTNLPPDPADESLIIAATSAIAAAVAAVDALATAIKAKTDNLPAEPAAVGSAMTLTSGERSAIAAELLDLADGVETGLTPRGALRAALAMLAGRVSGAGTGTEAFRAAVSNAKVRATVTVDDNGNRTAVVVDAA